MMDTDNRKQKHKELEILYGLLLEEYQRHGCQCAYPRYRQLAGMDLKLSMAQNLLLDASKKYFHQGSGDEDSGQEWTCKKCGSLYEYTSWEIRMCTYIQRLTATELKTHDIGAEANTPIPIYYDAFDIENAPSFRKVSLAELEDYLKEKRKK